MKRFLLCSALLLVAGRAAFATDLYFINRNLYAAPPQLPVIDAVNFVNAGGARFSVDMSQIQLSISNADLLLGPNTPFTTSSTRNYTNNGILIGIPGFDFENFPASSGIQTWADNFVNAAQGNFGGGEIDITNIYFGQNIFQSGFNALFPQAAPINYDAVGLASLKIRAKNVVNSGLISMDNSGLIDIVGNDLNLNRGRFVMTGTSSGVQALISSFAFAGNTNLQPWSPSVDLQPPFALSPVFPLTPNGLAFDEMFLTNAKYYFQDLNPPVVNSNIVWRVVILQDNSPSNVTASVYFGNDPNLGPGAFHIEWAGGYRDPLTGATANNFFYLNDEPGNQYFTNNYFILGVAAEYSINESLTKLTALAPTAESFTATPFIDSVTNNFAFLDAQATAALVNTNTVIGGSPTNLPGRIQLSSSNSMNLANTHISGPTYLRLDSPVNFLGNSNSSISAAYSDIHLGVTSGSLTVSNLLAPELPAWSGVPDAPNAMFISPMGGLQAFSATYKFIDANGFTNDVRILMVNSALRPSTPAYEKDMSLNSGNVLNISDALHVYNSFSSDATTLTLTTNANSAYSLAGEINFLSSDIFWAASFPNLSLLTNWGVITAPSLAVFADNMPTPTSDLSLATPYRAFINHGRIETDGAVIRANYFANGGSILEDLSGGLDIVATTAVSTNSTLAASNGPISIVGGGILISNTVLQSGQTLTLSAGCFLSDGYAFTNQFGHATNATLPQVVTNGNIWTVNGGVQILAPAPETGDLLGTTITNASSNSLDSVTIWAGEDRGRSPSGFRENLALGRMILVSDANPSHFTFAPAAGGNALYVDSIEFQGDATNTDNNGNYTAITVQPGMKIYYAQALINGVSIAEKLNGKNGGGFLWVSNYAGVYSSTNLNGTLYNEALVISPDIDSDNDTIVNVNDPTPIPPGLTFDYPNAGPTPCGGGTDVTGDTQQGSTSTSAGTLTPGLLKFPVEQQQGGSGGSVPFASAQGSYNGLFYDTNGVNAASAGSFSATLNKRGVFTAKLQVGADTYSLTSKFDQTGNFGPLTFTSKKQPSLTLTLQLASDDEITGQVTGADGWTAQLLAFRAVKNANSFGTGKHSLVLGLNSGNSTTTSGDSYGTMTLNKYGNIQWTGALPDGSKASQKSVLSKGGVWPLYSSLYGGNGTLIGWLQVTNNSSDIGGSAIWVAPTNPNSPFPNGVTNQLDATGSGLSSAPTGLQMTVILSGPQLPVNVTNIVTISGKSGTGDDSLKLSLDVKNGLFNGSMVDPNSSQTLSFQGALLEKSGIGGGFFLNADKNQGGKVSLAPAN